MASSWTRDRIHVPTLASRFLTIEPPGRSSKYVSFSLWLAFKDYYQDFFFPFPTLPLLSLPNLPSLCIVSKKFFNMFKSTNPRFFKNLIYLFTVLSHVLYCLYPKPRMFSTLIFADLLTFLPFRTCKLVTLWEICFIGAVQFF